MHDETVNPLPMNTETTDSPKQPFMAKLKKVVIEIIVIVFSVTVSIWLSNWSAHEQQQDETKEFLTDLKDDLQTDVKNITAEIATLEASKNGIATLLQLSPAQMESTGRIEMKVKFNNRRNLEANYEGFKSSGKIGYIEARQLKNNILSYYQEYMSVTTEMEKDLNLVKKEIVELLGRNDFKATALTDPLLRMKIEFYVGIADSLLDAYGADIKEAKAIIEGIDEYVD